MSVGASPDDEGSAGFRSGMSLVIRVSNSTTREVRVHLGAGQRLMTEQFLHGTKICAVVQEMRGETVPDGVRADLGVESDLFEVLRDLPTNRSAAQTAAMLVDEERRIGASLHPRLGEFRVVSVHVMTKRGQCMRSERDDAFRRPFPRIRMASPESSRSPRLIPTTSLTRIPVE